MSITSIASSTLLNYSSHVSQSNRHKWQQELEQLGQDLHSGNLSAAHADFATLQQSSPQIGTTSATSATPSSSPVAQDFSQLGKDLQAGNTSAAQQDYVKVENDISATSPGATTMGMAGRAVAGSFPSCHRT